MPFLDTLSTFHMKGSDLRGVLEYGVSQAESTQNEGTGRFLHVAGLKYSWTPNKPVGSRIIDVSVMSDDGSYVPLDDEAVYYVTASDFLRSAGDGFVLLRDKAIDPYDFGRDISEIFMDYLGKFSPVNPKIEGRIKKIGK